MTLVTAIREAFAPLVGLKLSIARDAGSMKVFHFGDLRPHPHGGTMGEFALHVQCPWRLTTVERIITGSGDFSIPLCGENAEGQSSEGEAAVSVQDARLLDLFGKYDPQTDSFENISEVLCAQSVEADVYGGVRIGLSGGFSLELMPAGSDDDPIGETWRLFRPFGVHYIFRPRGRLDREG